MTSQSTFDELYLKFSKQLLNYTESRTRDMHAAKDITQEVWLRVAEGKGEFDLTRLGACWGWLQTTALRMAIDRGNKNRKMVRLSRLRKRDREFLGVNAEGDESKLEPRDNCPTPEAELLTNEETEKIRKRMLLVEPVYRIVLDLRLRDLTLVEIAKEMNLSLPAVKARFHRGKAKLSAAMEAK